MSDTAPTTSEDTSAPVPDTRGARLQQARERAGLGLAEVAARLRLSPAQVEALERDDLQALPPATFVRGFVRNYARLLNVPAEDFEPERSPGTAPAAPAVHLQPPPPVNTIPLETGRTSANRRWLGAAAAALLIGAVIGAVRLEHLYGARDLVSDAVQGPLQGLLGLWRTSAPAPASAPVPSAAPLPAPLPAVGVADAVGPAAAATSAPAAGEAVNGVADSARPSAMPAVPGATPGTASTPAAAAATAPAASAPASARDAAGALNFSFAGDSWVEVRDSANAVLYSGTSHAGDVQSVPFNGEVRVVIGNATATRLELNGHEVALASHTKITVARLTLDAAGPRP